MLGEHEICVKNLGKANCSIPPGRNPAIFKFRDDACSQIKYSDLHKRKQEETENIPALSVPCSLLSTHSLGLPEPPSPSL